MARREIHRTSIAGPLTAADVCRAVWIVNTSQAVLRLDNKERGLCNVDTLGGLEEMAIISESGLYKLVGPARPKPPGLFFKSPGRTPRVHRWPDQGRSPL
jgi:hypothetical protein